MLLPVVFALAVPASFARMVEARLATTSMHVADWWVDDLDGDHAPESIAFVCDDDGGIFLVQHGSELLEAPVVVDGKNSCPTATSAPPAWRVKRSGVIVDEVHVHHGLSVSSFAVRDGQLVVVREESRNWDVNRDTSEEYHFNYDDLTWRQSIKAPHKPEVHTSGPLVLVTDQVRRTTRLLGRSTIAATHSPWMLHMHADRALMLRSCSVAPCETLYVAKGDSEVAIAADDELEIRAGRTTILVHFRMLEGEERYPHRPQW